jgi:type II secretion system protein G
MTRPAAFTLIELLIVVAIIAILAAIAVPNFLEAQTRSKVSRTKADMRTVTTAVESYRVDRNRYPPDAQFGVVPFLERLTHLTTPIAYITSVPPDPFANKSAIRDFVNTESEVNAYAPMDDQNNFHPILTFDFANRMQPGGIPESAVIWARISRFPGVVLWGMRSPGPDLYPAYLGRAVAPYDPTNGTISEGNIYWTGPGIGEDRPFFL